MTKTPAGVVLKDFLAKESERALPIVLAEGPPLKALPPELWPDEVTAKLVNKDDIAGAAALIIGGDTEYARFVAEGGNASILLSMIERHFGATVGKSSASSSS